MPICAICHQKFAGRAPQNTTAGDPICDQCFTEICEDSIRKAEHVGDVIHAYASGVGLVGEESETKLADLLADLQHWATREKVDFDECLALARRHYNAEIHGDEHEPRH